MIVQTLTLSVDIILQTLISQRWLVEDDMQTFSIFSVDMILQNLTLSVDILQTLTLSVDMILADLNLSVDMILQKLA